MIKGNRIIFGNGTTFVSLLNDNLVMRIIEVNVPREIGSLYTAKDNEDSVKYNYDTAIYIEFDKPEEVLNFIIDLDYIKKPEAVDKKVYFRRYVFDFTKYNELSVEAVYSRALIVFEVLTLLEQKRRKEIAQVEQNRINFVDNCVINVKNLFKKR
jgi:hypothetical protein